MINQLGGRFGGLMGFSFLLCALGATAWSQSSQRAGERAITRQGPRLSRNPQVGAPVAAPSRQQPLRQPYQLPSRQPYPQQPAAVRVAAPQGGPRRAPARPASAEAPVNGAPVGALGPRQRGPAAAAPAASRPVPGTPTSTGDSGRPLPNVRYFEWNGMTYREAPEGIRVVARNKVSPPERSIVAGTTPEPLRGFGEQMQTIPPTRAAVAESRPEPPIPSGRTGLRDWPTPAPAASRRSWFSDLPAPAAPPALREWPLPSGEVLTPVTEYRWERRVHGRWNPFVPNHVAYHWVPYQRWVRQPLNARGASGETGPTGSASPVGTGIAPSGVEPATTPPASGASGGAPSVGDPPVGAQVRSAAPRVQWPRYQPRVAAPRGYQRRRDTAMQQWMARDNDPLRR